MTRNVLSTFLCTLALGVGLVTAIVQSMNHAEAFELDEIWSECRMVEAVNNAHAVHVLALDLGPDAGLDHERRMQVRDEEGVQ